MRGPWLTPPASLGPTNTSCHFSTNQRPGLSLDVQSEPGICAEILWHQWLMSTVMANVTMTWRHNNVMTLSSWWQHRPNISFRNTWKLSNIGRAVQAVVRLLKVKRKCQQKFYFFARSPGWLVFSEAWRWVILIKARTNDISVGAKRALHGGMATNHQNMPRKLIIGTQSARLTSQHQTAETKPKANTTCKYHLHCMSLDLLWSLLTI